MLARYFQLLRAAGKHRLEYFKKHEDAGVKQAHSVMMCTNLISVGTRKKGKGAREGTRFYLKLQTMAGESDLELMADTAHIAGRGVDLHSLEEISPTCPVCDTTTRTHTHTLTPTQRNGCSSSGKLSTARRTAKVHTAQTRKLSLMNKQTVIKYDTR